MRRVTLKSSQAGLAASGEQPEGARQTSPLHMMMAGSAVSVLGLAAFMIGIYGSEAFTLAQSEPAIAQVATPAASAMLTTATPAASEPELSPESPPDQASLGDINTTDDVVADEKFANPQGRPAKPEGPPTGTATDTFNAGDDPWAALDQGGQDPGAQVQADGGDPATAADGAPSTDGGTPQ